ncbi:hypothetical protein OF83DRAFT_625985 [Amylostereum chailletii]|nr:hypothetical protein OF83DRAFT_625985 [Amylostereum chailletii]
MYLCQLGLTLFSTLSFSWMLCSDTTARWVTTVIHDTVTARIDIADPVAAIIWGQYGRKTAITSSTDCSLATIPPFVYPLFSAAGHPESHRRDTQIEKISHYHYYS